MTKTSNTSLLILVLSILFITSCTFKNLNELYTRFILNFPQIHYPINIDSVAYMSYLSNNAYQAIDTVYYPLLYDVDTAKNTLYYALGKFDMGANYEGLLYAKVKKNKQDTTIKTYLLVAGYDTFAYKTPLSILHKKADSLYIQRIIINNDEFKVSDKQYKGGNLVEKKSALILKLRQDKKTQQFRIDTVNLQHAH